ncbi:MAG: hypothetical protein A2V70_21190 [Planctomycetes bacterium RBG_13_63_9]|nr:MAG: hypothetical protein A2V70_21190 [Planctomycetes bacterium RBG_13_63_9]
MLRLPRLFCWSVSLALLGGLVMPCAARTEEPFDYFRNSWNVIALKDYRQGTRVSPENRLQLADQVTVRIRFGRKLSPLSRRQTKTLLDGWMPVVLLTADDPPVKYELKLWATPLPTVKDWHNAFDWPTETENFLNWIEVRATNTGSEQAEAKVKVERTGPSTSDEDVFAWSLAPGQSAQAVVRIPFTAVEDATVFAKEDPELWLQRTVDFWRGLMAGAARIEVPCRKATETLLAAHVCQLIANDHGEMHGGEGFYDEFYIRDAGYQIMELEEAGLMDATRKAVQCYLGSQRPDGRFETQTKQFDANGQAVWVLWQFYKITGDRPWLAEAYPQMRKAVDWTIQARRETPTDSPFAGLLPVAPADGEFLWDGKHHIVGYDLWNLRGMLCTADAARILGKTAEADELTREAQRYREAIDAAWKQTGLAHFPPSWEKDGTHWGNTETLWPTEIFPPDDPRVAALIEHARRQQGGGFIEGTIQWLGHPDAIHPYMSAYTTMADLARGNHQQVVEDFYWYLLHSTAAHAFPEGIFYKRRFAWGHTTPHVTGASNYALMLRHMLLHERGDELHLLPAVPDGWLADGKQIRVQRAPTHFGAMGLSVRGTATGVQLKLDPPRRQPPARIVLHLPKSRPLLGSVDGVEVVVRPDQKQRWDFPAVVNLYREQAAPLLKPIPALVALPLDSPLKPAQCRMLDLAPLLNTNPLTAPFGVENPGKFLFTGLPLGVQSAGGVPFRMIDPAANAGRGLLVLHSPSAPKELDFPRQVEIPVGARGKRLFFLGNVHGWSPQDPGTGPWGAVAEYVIHYADGQTQTVPLITGRTADEWTAEPEADEVHVGFQGKPWHLNVLGVALRSVPVEKVIFRDLGTPAAPVLAAVTLQQ